MLATHHAGNGHRLLVIGNHQGIFGQFHFLAIQQHQLFSGLCHAHHNAALDLFAIERVHGLAKFQHDVVGDIHRRVNGTDTGATQLFLHPQRGFRLQVHVAQHPAQIAGTAGGSFHTNVRNF